MSTPNMRKSSASLSLEGHQPFAIRGPPAEWFGFLDLHSKGRYAPLDLRNTGSSGSRGSHLAAGHMSRGPHSYRHQRRLTTPSISHWCAFAMAVCRTVGRSVEKDVAGGVEYSTR